MNTDPQSGPPAAPAGPSGPSGPEGVPDEAATQAVPTGFQVSPRELSLLVLLVICWGLNWPVMKAGVQDFGAISFRTLSMIGGIPVLWAIARARKIRLEVPREHWRELLVLATTNMVLWYVFAMWGVKLLSSGRAAILGYTMPIWVAIIGFLLFGEKPSPRIAVGVAAAALGVLLLLSSEFASLGGSPVGTVAMLVAAISWALGTHLMRRRRQTTHPVALTFWSIILSTFVCAVVALLTERASWTRPPNGLEWFCVAYNAIVVMGIAQVLWFRLASLVPPLVSGLSIMAIPAVGLFSGMALLGETPHWQDYAALLCILVAIASVLLPQRRTGGRP